MLAEDQDRLLQAADGVQRGVIDTMRGIGADSPDTYARLMRTQAVQQDLGNRIAGLPYVAALLLFDRHRALLNFSRGWPPPPLPARIGDFIRDMGGADVRRCSSACRRAERSPAAGRSISAAGSTPPMGSFLVSSS